MKPAPFAYERPDTLQAALGLLADQSIETRLLAGGQSLVPMMNFRVARPERLIDINRIAGLDHIDLDGDVLRIGAMARHNAVKGSKVVAQAAPIIPMAYEWVAHGTVRNRGTIGGNLCHADPASEMPMLMRLLGAELVVRSSEGERTLPATEFFVGLYETALEPEEMLVEICVPAAPEGQGHGFEEVSLRKGDFGYCFVGATVRRDGDAFAALSVGIGGIASTAVTLDGAGAALRGKSITDEAAIADAIASDIAGIDIIGDQRVPSAYRRDLAQTLALRAIKAATKNAS
ncbi:xanthine dehydrogenase family protein subunit M [Thalassococcus sp. S3]|uniref:FAD binding domain-containing protein n=1 Tax=Thalassococcus sp. S3 TaxID=2017482 RepID=UPI0010243B8C|nr:xanthine dehydrogenase family protein subunit M [Thalassococcus sp. S3]QBF30805.1 carbon monoxide dehydrogenase [Thalassococcus sp. S3]